jgi:hypothetical protein
MGDKTRDNLVEPQGVNAEEPSPGTEPDVRSGGDVEQAPDRRQGLIGFPDEKTDEELTGNAPEPEPHPQNKDGSSGQDSGLMD